MSILRDSEKLKNLVNEAQKVLGRTISLAEQAIIINMVNYYELKPEVVLMILEYYKNEKQKGMSISFSYINAMAKIGAMRVSLPFPKRKKSCTKLSAETEYGMKSLR